MSKNTVLRQMHPLVLEEFGPEAAPGIMAAAREALERLIQENAGEPKAWHPRTRGDAYPCISLYKALKDAGIGQSRAVAFLDRSWSRMAEKKAASMRSMMKIPGLYRTMPFLFCWVARHQFGEKQGFAAKFYPTGSRRARFDMTRCLYCDICRRYRCPELIPCFCHTDDVTNENIHPRLCWHRTRTMGEGGSLCDFDLYIS